MSSKRITKSVSLSIELVNIIDSCDRKMNISKLVEKLLYEYFKQQGNISEVIEKNKKKTVEKEKSRLDQFKEVLIASKGNLTSYMNKHWEKELNLDTEEYENIKKKYLIELNLNNIKSNKKKSRIKTYG